MSDHLTLDAPRRTKDGYMAVRAKAARTGHYAYSGRDVDPSNMHGLRDTTTVNVLRDADQVFAAKAAHSFIGKPITDNHPADSVTSANWKDHARGTIMGAKWEEGGYLAFDLMLTDESAIKAVDSGKRELSNGYSCELEFGDFTAADGTKCLARQANIVGNHIALVDKGRAGPECRIVDAAACDAISPTTLQSIFTDSGERTMKKLTIDGLLVDLADAEAVTAVVAKLQGAAAAAITAKDTAEAALATTTTLSATKDAEIATLKQQVSDAKLTPQQLRDAGKAYALTLDTAKKLAPSLSLADTMDEAAIKKAVVSAKLGDVAKDWTDAQVDVSFATMATATPVTDSVRTVMTNGIVQIGDASARETSSLAKANDHNAWRNASAAA
ncbi:DUF2213 domain-containing protein [Sphingomonas paeninsulae]|nr:DUF2213 domain-containing protein [Sphingomonas paeninsulae]